MYISKDASDLYQIYSVYIHPCVKKFRIVTSVKMCKKNCFCIFHKYFKLIDLKDHLNKDIYIYIYLYN